jgi:predicted Zn-dependent protease
MNLATDQIHTGDLKAARATCDRAVADHLDGDRVRARYLELAYLLHDQELLQEQISWGKTHPDAVFLLQTEASFAIAEGRFSDAHKLMAQVSAMKRQQGLSDTDDEDAKQQALDLMQAGDMEEGKKIFKQSPIHPNEGGEMLGLIYSGDIPAARDGLRTMQAKFPNGTMWNFYWEPLIDATIAMQEHRPKDAAAILEKATPLEATSLAIPRLRGEAYLAAGQPDLAEKNFRAVISHPELDAGSPAIPLSWLDLGRALAAKGDRTGAIDSYKHFLVIWAHADPDALYLRQAKQELASLEAVPARK